MKKVFNLHNISLLLIVAIISIFSTIRVNATTTWNSSTNSATIEKTVSGISNPITNSFSYTVTADNSNPAGVTGSITPASPSISFTTSDAVTNHEVTKQLTIDFSNLEFSHPGVYKWTIAESASGNEGTYPHDTKTYTVEITVQNTNASNPDGQNFTAYLFVKDGSTKVAKAEFETTADQNDFGHIKLTKAAVTGSDADVTDYFEYEVKVYAAGTYTISNYTTSATCGTNTTNPSTATTTITGGSTTTPSTIKLCLKKSDIAYIGQDGSLDTIPSGTKIDIIETNTDYTESYKINNGSAVSSNSLTNHTLAAGETTVAFTNTKTGTTPTGVLITTLPYVLLIIAAVAGALVFVKFKNQKTETINE